MSEPTETKSAKNAAREAKKKNAELLYEQLGKAGFNRDSFITLGEAVQKNTGFRDLHPAVVIPLMRIANGLKLVPVPVVPAEEEPKADVKAETKPDTAA